MKTFNEALDDGYTEQDGYYGFRFGDEGEYELTFESLLFGQWYVALYRNGELLTEKVPVRRGGSLTKEER